MFNNHLMKACLAAVFAIGLAACSSSDDSAEAPTTPTEPTTPTQPPAPADLTALFADAQDASDDAAQAGEDAAAAQKSATDSRDMLSTTEVGGESATAMASAQAILDAADDAAQAVMDAEAALAAANKAKTDAEAIADDHPQKSSLMEAIDDAIEAAEAQIEATKMVRDGTAIRNAVAEVTGGPQGTGTPRSRANAVGKDISDALVPTDTSPQRTGTRIAAHATDGPAETIAAALKHEANDAQGMTWAMIVGEDNVMMMRLGSVAADGTLTVGNGVVSVASLAGMTATDVTSTTLTDGTIDADGGTTAGSYMGIVGAVICLGGSDGCKVTDGKLDAGWYFSPGAPMTYYQNRADDPATDADEALLYEAETLYAEYGHWLVPDTSDPVLWTVHTFSSSAGGTDANLVEGTEDNMLGDTATYSGSAAGMSVRRMGSGDSATTDSGRFTADVELRATFGAAAADARIRGTIDNFVGNAVNSGWSVNLESAVLGTSEQSGVATGTGRDGEWDATAYGDDAAKRPAGIHGAFVAHFSDGDAAGAFATRLDP